MGNLSNTMKKLIAILLLTLPIAASAEDEKKNVMNMAALQRMISDITASV